MVYFSRVLTIFFACYILANTVYLIDSGSASNLEVKYKHEIVFTTVSLLMLQIKSKLSLNVRGCKDFFHLQ